MLNDLLLLSGNDIPFPKARLTIHQPTIKEIAYIGEEAFFIGCELLNFSKDLLSSEDKSNLTNTSNFDVLMSIMRDKKTSAIQKNRVCAMMVLSLIFPDYRMTIGQDKISFVKTTEAGEQEGGLNKDTYEEFKDILVQMFCLKRNKSDAQDYNPQNEYAKRLADKMKAGREKAAKAKGEMQKISVFSRYVSILAVGQYKTINEVMQYTVYQIFDEFERYELKEDFDTYLRAKLAGAKDLKEAENWMKEIHT